MTTYEQVAKATELGAAEARHALVQYLAFLAETDHCRALLTWLGDFVDTVRVLDDGRLEARMTCAQRELRITPPSAELDADELASLRAVWGHAGRIEVSPPGAVDPISLLGPDDAGTWVDSAESLFDGCEILDDLESVVDQLYDEDGPRGGGTSPIHQARSANIGPWFVLDARTTTSRGEPALRRVSRNRGKPDYVIGPVLSTELGLGAAFLRIIAGDVLGVADAVAFGPYVALRAAVAAGSSRFVIHRGERRAAHIRVTEGLRGQQVHVWEGGFAEKGTTRWVKPIEGLHVIEQAQREAGGYVERGFVDLAAS